jgi:NAD+ synthase
MNCPLDRLTIAVAQLNPTVGDVAGNAEKARRAAQAAAGADLVIFPELFIAGYPPEDLVLKPAFQEACRTAVQELARETAGGPALLIGSTAVRSRDCASRSICRTTACSMRSACSPPARCRGR